MRADEAEAKFKEADESYRQGRYTAALTLLDELNEAFPDEKRVLFPRARCLAKLGRTDEALAICDDLIQRFGYEKAVALRERLVHAAAAPTKVLEKEEEPDDLSLEALNLDLDETPAESAFRKAPAVTSSGGGSVAWKVAAGVFVVAAAGAAVYFGYFRESDGAAADDSPAAADAGAAGASGGSTSGRPTIDTSGPPEMVKTKGSASEGGVTVNMSVEYAVWTSEENYAAFERKYAACEPAGIRMEVMGMAFEYYVVGGQGGQCAIEMKAASVPSMFSSWSGKSMTCSYDPSMDFIRLTEALNPEKVMNGEAPCTGPLADAMRATASGMN